METTPLLDVKVDFNGAPAHLKGAHGEVLMIPFRGTVTGEIFQGIVEPCGVDTQVVNAAGVRHMSARYMLTGTDSAGNPARIYVENNGWFTNGENPSPFTTVPTFFTDSPFLAPLLRGPFIGKGVSAPDGLHIRFYPAE